MVKLNVLKANNAHLPTPQNVSIIVEMHARDVMEGLGIANYSTLYYVATC